MANDALFDTAIEVFFEHEGGDQLVTDQGGLTRYGISQKAFPSLDIENLTRDVAEDLIERLWWQKHNWGELPPQVAIKCLDIGANVGGPGQLFNPVNLCLQRAIRACGQTVAEDGIMGPATITAARAVFSLGLLPALKSEIAGYYRLIIARHPEYAKDKSGWEARAYS